MRLKFIAFFASLISLFVFSTYNAVAVSNLCPGAEACPYPGDPGRLWSCHPGESDGTVTESLCNQAGRVETCGVTSSGQPKPWCCPRVGGSWTTTLSACPSPPPTPVPTPSPSPVPSPTPGPVWDVNQDGFTDIIDIGLVVNLYNLSPSYYPRADVNRDGFVDIIDIGIVIDHYNF